MPEANDRPNEERRREIFAALVATQDRGVSVANSRQQIANQYGVTRETVAEIEREGMDNEWPPL